MASTFTWSYDGSMTVVLEFSDFPANSGHIRLDCSDDKSNTPQSANVPVGEEGHFAITSVGFKYGNGPGFTATLSDVTEGTTLASHDFTIGTRYGDAITVEPYGLELGDQWDLTPDRYQDPNTVVRWNNVGYYDGIFGRAAQTGLGTNQVWYDSGYETGFPIRAQMSS